MTRDRDKPLWIRVLQWSALAVLLALAAALAVIFSAHY